ncbi:putative polysaccharide biosynthesis protein [Kineosphaera limosa NBRC 100340]|uniref:Putative polysaccharide biosynthesis protein n=1 Tax=Kineosphaera limosa NBRC 100340 TaxID=1184609 RepID=K6WCT6_9MICO|nr:putative polysaccharide biosynthesis protein [Kineosphaera limosa NBRC 100340]
MLKAVAPEVEAPAGRVVVTGAAGFLGWHTRARLATLGVFEGAGLTSLGRAQWEPESLAEAVRGLGPDDLVVQLAGINRGADDNLAAGNVGLARDLIDALEAARANPTVIFAGSNYADDDHPGRDTPYGRGKRAAGEALRDWGARASAPVVEFRFPGLFGEHGRPDYNSFVATFAHRIANGAQPEVVGDRELPLIHVQDAVALLLGAAHAARVGEAPGQRVVHPLGRPVLISAMAQRLRELHATYAPAGDIPALRDTFDVRLFNTLRAAMWPSAYPFRPTAHRDERGALVETVRVHPAGSGGQAFVSTTRPGFTRGNHVHLAKIERFQVISGSGVIRLRRLLEGPVLEFAVDGEHPAVIDMPTLWTHSIENTGDTPLVTAFWANELLDPQHPDTYPMAVLDGPDRPASTTPVTTATTATGRPR